MQEGEESDHYATTSFNSISSEIPREALRILQNMALVLIPIRYRQKIMWVFPTEELNKRFNCHR